MIEVGQKRQIPLIARTGDHTVDLHFAVAQTPCADLQLHTITNGPGF
jgi:hypothetical protein